MIQNCLTRTVTSTSRHATEQVDSSKDKSGRAEHAVVFIVPTGIEFLTLKTGQSLSHAVSE